MSDIMLANEIFLERMKNCPHIKENYEREAEISGMALIKQASQLFNAWVFEVRFDVNENFCEFSDGEIEIIISYSNGKFFGYWEEEELNFGRYANENLVFDMLNKRWVGPPVMVSNIIAGERVSQVVRDFSKEGAPVVRLSALEVLTELIFDAFKEAKTHKHYSEVK